MYLGGRGSLPPCIDEGVSGPPPCGPDGVLGPLDISGCGVVGPGMLKENKKHFIRNLNLNNLWPRVLSLGINKQG